MTPAQVTLSKRLSFLLRHGASDRGLNPRRSGWVLARTLASVPGIANLNPSPNDWDVVLERPAKPRFQAMWTQGGNLLAVRAWHGHADRSIDHDDASIPVAPETERRLVCLVHALQEPRGPRQAS